MKKTVLALSVLATIITSCGQQNVIVTNDNTPPFSEKRLIATIYDGNINMTAPVYTLKSSGLNKSTVDTTDIKQAFPEYKSIVFMEISEIDPDAVSSIKLAGTEKIRQQSCEYDVNRNGICDLARNIQASQRIQVMLVT